ncbi:lipopolysaccharide biosynthesis protein [Massilia arenosa]|uniref:Lipopolysaccharide biosynthesis protein n=1 Tax=Zemynaea arenosa TaxID=2561931 RepID=A0A4Y9SAL7_9BURK|nr:GNVR domain-containing protein [Massilia arenosa]TFW16757.1 lipopolysaccharide biosynthesis protein [Massilia arenosa]
MTVLDLLELSLKRWRYLASAFGICLLISFSVAWLFPNIYRANTKILPPQQAQSGAAALLAQLGGVASAAAGAAGIKNPNDLYVGMLHSRTIADSLIARFHLKDVYGHKLMDSTRNELDENTSITTGKDGLINIEVEDTDPKRAAAIANAYADELLKLTKTLAVTEAGQRRLFFERQLEQSKENLARAEVTLKKAMGARGVISVDAESRSIVETVARLRALVSAKEIERRTLAAFVTANNSDLKRVDEAIASARLELSKLENGGGKSEEVVGTANGLENIKLLRDVKYHQMLYELLSKQYEIARLDETKDSSIVQVLDKAVEPERKAKPARALIALAAGCAGLLLALAWLVLAEQLAHLRRQRAT